ncbi:MAG TPA: insulinase family protein [Candidatus Tumulicola sp.]
MKLRVISAAIAASIALAPATLLAAAGDVPSPTVENRGGTTIVRQADPHSSLVGIVLVVHAGLDRQTMKQSGLAALVAQTILRTPVTLPSAKGPAATMPLEQAVAANGGSVRFTIDPGDVRVYVEALAPDAPAVVALVRQALSAPDFAPATVRDARSTLTHGLAQSQQHSQYALQVGLDMLNQASSPEANAGLPALGTATSLAQLVPADVATFYHTYYRRGGAVVSAAGKLDALDPDALASLVDALAEGTTAAVTVRVPALRGSSREIVAHRDIASPWLIAQYPAPSVDSKDFGAMLVLSAFVGRTLAEMAQVPGSVSPSFASRAVGAEYSYDRVPAHLVLYVNGGIGNPSRTFATALSIVNVLASTRLAGTIDQFKAEAAGDFATGATTLETRAWLAAVFSRGSASPDFLGRALRAIAATTPADVQRVARTYLGTPTIALVLPRDGNDQN